jgi:hypothetical protein
MMSRREFAEKVDGLARELLIPQGHKAEER